MARRKVNTLSRKKPSKRQKDVCWISSEGTGTEYDYYSMDVFKEVPVSIKHPRNVHPKKREPIQVLKRLKEQLAKEDFRKGDEAWVVVDVDTWKESELDELYKWEASDSRYHVAVSNPKFELFLLMHYDDAKGCTTPSKVDAKLKGCFPLYDKRLSPRQFNEGQVRMAIQRSRTKRISSKGKLPAPGSTDAHLLAERLLPIRP